MTEAERKAKLERALAWAGPTHTVADVVDMCRRGEANYWQHGDGMIVTEINDYPLLRAVNYWLVFGELEACLAMQGEIDTWAREQGCTIATAMGRRGWGRAGAPSGWKLWHPNFIKQLDKEAGP